MSQKDNNKAGTVGSYLGMLERVKKKRRQHRAHIANSFRIAVSTTQYYIWPIIIYVTYGPQGTPSGPA